MTNTSIFNAFERMWYHILNALNNKANTDAIIPKILTAEFYGDELPEEAEEGRIFFKKVSE